MVQRVHSLHGTLAGSRSVRSRLAEINVLARGASNAKWHSGCLAPDRCVESICDWLIRGPLFCADPFLGTALMDNWKVVALVIVVPPVLIVAALLIADSLQQKARFSLRSLLVWMTLAAVVLGLTSYALRK
jgi:hypothetical protein